MLVAFTELMAKEVCTWHYEGVYAVYDMADWDVIVQNCWSLADEEDREAYFIGFEENHELIGFGRIQLENDFVTLGIGLKPEYCGKGYGVSYMKALIEESQKRYPEKKITLEVRHFNKRAIRCYEKVGFITERKYMKETLHGFIAYDYMVYEESEKREVE